MHRTAFVVSYKRGRWRPLSDIRPGIYHTSRFLSACLKIIRNQYTLFENDSDEHLPFQVIHFTYTCLHKFFGEQIST